MSKIIITHEFDNVEDALAIKAVLNGEKYHSLLWELDQDLRMKIKHDDKICENEYFCDYLETLRARINELDIYE